MKKRLLKTACLLAAAALLLTGCRTEMPAGPAGLPGEAGSEEEPEVPLPSSFTLPYAPDQTLDPVTCADGMQQVVGSLLYEGLFRLDEQLQPQPCLCQSYTYDPAALTYTFTLRSGVTFSDGSPLTAADAAAVLWRAKSSQRLRREAVERGRLLRRGRNADRHSLLSRHRVPRPAGHPHREVRYGGQSGPRRHRALRPLHRRGGRRPHRPCRLVGRRRTAAERIALAEARDRDAMLYLFSSHDVQLITADLIGTDPITATGNISYRDADTTVLHYVGFNVRRAPFSDIAVRRALGLGINRTTLASAVLSGHARATQFPVSPVSPLYPDELETLYSYDSFAEAMASAGLTSGQPRTATLL